MTQFDPYDLEDYSYHIPSYYLDVTPNNWYYYGSRNNKVNLIERIPRYESEWKSISQRMGKKFNVIEIWKIQNARIYKRYDKTYDKYSRWYGREPRTWELFHGTQIENIESIIHDNFDLRNAYLKDTSFYFAGKGVYFTQSANYANWCVGDEYPKFMFNCEVLINNIYYVYNPNDVRFGPPPLPGCEEEVASLQYQGIDPHPKMLYDTTSRKGKDEFVKFGRNEYYPKHLIMYEELY